MQHLRQPCSPDEYLGVSDEHKHRCSCGTTWKHRGVDCRVSSRAFDLGHTCPNCGKFVDLKYFTDEEQKERAANLGLLELIALFEELAGNIKAYDRDTIDPDFDDWS